MMLHNVHCPWAGADNPLGPNFRCQQEGLITMVICCKFKKESLQPLTLYTSFHDLINVYSRRSGAENPRDKILMSAETSCHFRHLLQVSKKSLCSLILYNIFHDFIHVYSPGAGADNPLGTKFWCQQEHLVTSVICCKFQKNVWFYTIFFMILYMYIALEQGQTAPRGQSFDVNRKALSLYPFVASFKEMSLKSDFIPFFSWFYTCI